MKRKRVPIRYFAILSRNTSATQHSTLVMIPPKLRPAGLLALVALLATAPLAPAATPASTATPAAASTASPRGKDVQFLSGTGADDTVTWDFYCTAGNRSGEWTKIRVPSCWEQEGFGTYYYGVWRRNNGSAAPEIPNEQGKYRTTFTVPAAWKGTSVRIVFAGVMTDTEVLVNGKPAGPVHQGGFYQFDYDISALLDYGGGQNTLEVNVSKESANESVNKAERRGDYWTFGGIYRPVWLESRPAQHIDRVAIDARADGTFTADVYLGTPAPAAATITAQIIDAHNRPAGPPITARIATGADRVTLRAAVPSPLPWTAETPNLHTAVFTYSNHEYTRRFGFRTIEVRPGDGIYLNGARLMLKGIDRHSFRPETGRTLTRAQCYDDARLIKEMNMNAVRMSHYPPDSAFLEACDELGLYVLDELAGWQGAYDTPTGARLIGQIIRRDVNHPSIILWVNGNEGGWNTDNDAEFAKWDPQRRNVIHPWSLHDNINTKHYPKYDLLQQLCAAKDIFMPTEFLHGLYDGGHGAGLADYWRVMTASPVCAGGFLWVFADEGIARTDDHGRIDNAGNLAPDGILGPRHERKGSFLAVKELWSPVTLGGTPGESSALPPDWNGIVELQNHYAFTNLKHCTFEWSAAPVPSSPARKPDTVEHKGKIASPDIAPGAKGTLKITLPPQFRADIISLRALDPAGHELWTWSWFTPWHGLPARERSAGRRACRFEQHELPARERSAGRRACRFEWHGRLAHADRVPPATRPCGLSCHDLPACVPKLFPEGPQTLVRRGPLSLRFDNNTGLLIAAFIDGQPLPLTAGPTLTAYIRDNRRFTNLLPPHNETRVNTGTIRAKVTTTTAPDGSIIIEAAYPAKTAAGQPGTLDKITWTIPPGDAGVRLDYEYHFEGKADLLGVNFELPERTVLSKRWLGRGPWRVYRNRMEGGVLGVHAQNYNDPLPGQTYVNEPEFKGYFRDWRWLELTTTAGRVALQNNAPPGSANAPFIGLWRPRDGVPMMMEFPDTGLAILDLIPAQGSKFDNAGNTGPTAATPDATGKRTGSVTLTFAK